MPVMSGPQKKITAAEFLQWPDDGRHQELIDGVHYVTPSPKFSHQEIIGRLTNAWKRRCCLASSCR